MFQRRFAKIDTCSPDQTLTVLKMLKHFGGGVVGGVTLSSFVESIVSTKEKNSFQRTCKPLVSYLVRILPAVESVCNAGYLVVAYSITKLNWSVFCQGYYDSSDDGVMDEDGFVSIMARTDDVINVAGHRISTKALEEVKLKPRMIKPSLFFTQNVGSANVSTSNTMMEK